MEWHGWATIRASAGVEDDEVADRAEARANRAVAALVAACDAFNEVYDLRMLNGLFSLSFSGAHNHRSNAPVTFLETVAATAPGSYGVLYLYDEEDPRNRWERWVMRRGRVIEEADTSLTPHVGRVEDEWPEDRPPERFGEMDAVPSPSRPRSGAATVPFDLWRSDAVVLFDWLMSVDLDAVPVSHPAQKQALMDLLTRIRHETDIPGVAEEQISAAQSEVSRDMGW